MLSSSRVAFATKNTPSLNVPQGLKPPSGGPVSSPVSRPINGPHHSHSETQSARL